MAVRDNPRTEKSPAWPEDHIAALRKHVEAGLSFAQTAKALNEQFGTSYTRNACIGKAGQLGIAGKKYSIKRITTTGHAVIAARNIARKKPPQFSPRIGSFVSTGGANGGQPIDREANPVPLRAADVVPKHISFEDMKRGLCKYPFGHALPFTFCGCQTFDDRPYCPQHHALVRGDVRRGHSEEATANHRKAAIARGYIPKSAALAPNSLLDPEVE